MKPHYYISKSFILKTGILDLSEDQIKRNIKRIASEEQKIKANLELGEKESWDMGLFVPTVCLKRNENGIKEWHINYAKINEIGRKRRIKKNTINKVKQRIERGKRNIIKYTTKEPSNPKYTTEISLNFKENYDVLYYEEVVKELFIRYQKNMYFVIEIDNEGFTHLHIGSEGKKQEIKILMNHILENVLASFDDSYIKFLEEENYLSDLHISDIISHHAYKKYLEKGNDGLGGVSIKFLNVN